MDCDDLRDEEELAWYEARYDPKSVVWDPRSPKFDICRYSQAMRRKLNGEAGNNQAIVGEILRVIALAR